MSIEAEVFGKINTLLRRLGIRPAYLLIPILLSFATAAFEGVSVGLLVPLSKGVLTLDFRFMQTMKGLKEVLAILPDWVSHSNKALLVLLLLFFISTVLLKNITRYGSVMSMSFFAYRSSHYLRRMIFGRYLGFGRLYFDRTNVGHHSTLLTTFTDYATRPLLSVDKHMNALFSLVTYLVVMFTISWKLTVFAIPLFIILHVSVRHLIIRIRALSRTLSESINDLGKTTVEILSTLPLVTATNMEEDERRHFSNISDQMAKQMYKTTMLMELTRPIQELETLIAILLLLGVVFLLAAKGQTIESSLFLVYVYLVVNSAGKFSLLTSFRSNMATALGPIDEVLTVFDDADKCYVTGGSREFTGLQKNIDFRKLHFAYDAERTVLRDISFTAKHGQMTAIVGPTGSGKTTIINLLLRYYDCPPGTILLDDTDIREFTVKSLRSHMALVSQETYLLHDSLRENILYGLHDVSDERLHEAIQRSRLGDLVKALPAGLGTLIGDRGTKLSGGEKQRVSIARALLKNAEILLLDEATSSLDTQTEKLVQEAIDDVSQGRTVLVIAHRLSTIRNANHIVFLEGGRCVEQGGFDELLSHKGRFHEHWNAQMQA